MNELRLGDDLDLIVALADHLAREIITSFGPEQWRQSPLRKTLDLAVGRMIQGQCKIPTAVAEALERMEAARTSGG